MPLGREMRAQPELVSVVVPVFNAESTIGVALQQLAAQDYAGRWELVLVDNRCTDSSIEIAEQWRDHFPEFRIVPAMDRAGASHARNVGVRHAQGELIATCDADDRAVPSWLRQIVFAALQLDVVAGQPRLSNSLNPHRKFQDSESEAVDSHRHTKLGYLPYASSSNSAAWRSVIDAVGGWDEDLVGGSEDVDFSWRAQRLGFSFGYEPTAIIDYRERTGLRALARQRFNYGVRNAQLIDRYRSEIPIEEQRVSAREVILFPPRILASILLRRTPPAAGMRSLVAYLSGRAGLWVGSRRDWPAPSSALRGVRPN